MYNVQNNVHDNVVRLAICEGWQFAHVENTFREDGRRDFVQ